MLDTVRNLSIVIVLAPLVGSLIAGLFAKCVGRRGAHYVTILGVTIAFVAALYVAKLVVLDNAGPFNFNLYTWAESGSFHFNVGFLVDRLTALMLITVTFVSLMVHIYSIGYMAEDDGYQRFFSYISLFTFAMLTLVLANNFMLLYFGWEGVGLVSYLLIGFWFKRESANFGSLKAFLVNRVGDFGFILGIAVILTFFKSVDYAQVFSQVQQMTGVNFTILPGVHSSIVTIVCILLLIGAMGKSAQVPLHVWLPESMEGPTPISALIHAATMVTAGVYMIARMSPIYEYSSVALSLVLVIGATGALFTGILGIVQQDIKRVVAYSTLSQLGYMVAGLGVSAYAAGFFHLMTHASFKALLFLSAGSVIVAMHHEQDMRRMGNLKKYMPLTYVAFFIGALSLSAIPPFAGFYSKDAIIEAIHLSHVPGAGYAYICVLLGTFVTALYIFRALFMTFHTQERMGEHLRSQLKESPWVIGLPLVLLAIPSVILGYFMDRPILYNEAHALLGHAIFVLPQHDVLAKMALDYHGPFAAMLHAFSTLPFWLALAGIFTAWLCYIKCPAIPRALAEQFAWLYGVLVKRYGFDDFNQIILVRGTRKLASFFYRVTDDKVIDGYLVNGSGQAISWLSKVTRLTQSGYLYHYAFAMVIGLLVFLCWLLLG